MLRNLLINTLLQRGYLSSALVAFEAQTASLLYRHECPVVFNGECVFVQCLSD